MRRCRGWGTHMTLAVNGALLLAHATPLVCLQNQLIKESQDGFMLSILLTNSDLPPASAYGKPPLQSLRSIKPTYHILMPIIFINVIQGRILCPSALRAARYCIAEQIARQLIREILCLAHADWRPASHALHLVVEFQTGKTKFTIISAQTRRGPMFNRILSLCIDYKSQICAWSLMSSPVLTGIRLATI